MGWLHCCLSIALDCCSIMCIRGARSSHHHPAMESIDLQLAEGQFINCSTGDLVMSIKMVALRGAYTVWSKILAGNLFWQIGGFESNPPIFLLINLCNHMVFLLDKPDCARPIDLSSAWSSQLTAVRGLCVH